MSFFSSLLTTPMAAILGLLASPATRAEPASRALVITGVTVIDTAGGAPLEDRTVVIRDGRIAEVREASTTRPPADAEVVVGSGRFLIPGLWNMHVHSVSYDDARKAFPSVLAGGVTGVRDMGAPLDDVLRLRRETRDGSLLGPHMVVAGPLLEGPLPPELARLPLLRGVSTSAEAREAVRSLQERGVDFVKVDGSLPVEVFEAVAATARHLGIPFAGHVASSVGAVLASEAGQRSFEHLGPNHAVLLACSRREAELGTHVRDIFAELVKAVFRGEEPNEAPLFRSALTRALLESYDDDKAAALFERFKKNGTWQDPTLVALRGLWDRSDLEPDDVRYGERLRAQERQIVGSMSRSGVKLLAGSDGPLDGAAARLHEELELLVQSGLSPLQALQAATRNPAEFLSRLDSLGTVSPGKRADLVLLDANPLEDIRNVRRVAAVVLSGKLVAKPPPE